MFHVVYDFNANLYKDSIIFLITNKTEGKGSRFLRSLRLVEMTGLTGKASGGMAEGHHQCFLSFGAAAEESDGNI